MKISLVIPCHNLEDYIEPLLCSLNISKAWGVHDVASVGFLVQEVPDD